MTTISDEVQGNIVFIALALFLLVVLILFVTGQANPLIKDLSGKADILRGGG